MDNVVTFHPDVKDLVFVENNAIFTDSLTVAKVFGREHYNVLRDIKNLDCSEEFGALNFEATSYLDEWNREKPKQNMTRNGLTFLVMGYNGEKAARFKEAYIAAFDKMEAYIRSEQAKNDHKLIKQSMLKAVCTGHWISNRMQAHGITMEMLSTYYFYRMNWLTRKEARKAFDLTYAQEQVMVEILKKEGHEMPDVRINKRDKALFQLHFSETANNTNRVPTFQYFK